MIDHDVAPTTAGGVDDLDLSLLALVGAHVPLDRVHDLACLHVLLRGTGRGCDRLTIDE